MFTINGISRLSQFTEKRLFADLFLSWKINIKLHLLHGLHKLFPPLDLYSLLLMGLIFITAAIFSLTITAINSRWSILSFHSFVSIFWRFVLSWTRFCTLCIVCFIWCVWKESSIFSFDFMVTSCLSLSRKGDSGFPFALLAITWTRIAEENSQPFS